MSESPTMYKVVAERQGELTSAIALGEPTVVYEPGVWATASRWMAKLGYHLLVFETLETAERFSKDTGIITSGVWEVEVDGVLGELPSMLLTVDTLHSDVTWESLRVLLHPCKWPVGTVMVERVRLLRRVGGGDGRD